MTPDLHENCDLSTIFLSWSLWPWGRFKQNSLSSWTMQSLVLRATFTPFSRSCQQQAELLADCLKCAGKANEGRERPCWTHKAASHNNVAVAVICYFLSLSSHFLCVTYFFLPSYSHYLQRKNKTELEGIIMPASCRRAGRSPTGSCSQGCSCLCKCEGPSGLPLFFPGFLFFLFILGWNLNLEWSWASWSGNTS